jgi:hypothetical protein
VVLRIGEGGRNCEGLFYLNVRSRRLEHFTKHRQQRGMMAGGNAAARQALGQKTGTDYAT